MTDKKIYGSFDDEPTIPNNYDVLSIGVGFGYTGSSGEPGPSGPQGPRGYTGYTGSRGLNGEAIARVGMSPPGAPIEGALWYDLSQSNQQLKIYLNKYGWVPVALPSAVLQTKI
jgi:hypothetical protein